MPCDGTATTHTFPVSIRSGAIAVASEPCRSQVHDINQIVEGKTNCNRTSHIVAIFAVVRIERYSMYNLDAETNRSAAIP